MSYPDDISKALADLLAADREIASAQRVIDECDEQVRALAESLRERRSIASDRIDGLRARRTKAAQDLEDASLRLSQFVVSIPGPAYPNRVEPERGCEAGGCACPLCAWQAVAKSLGLSHEAPIPSLGCRCQLCTAARLVDGTCEICGRVCDGDCKFPGSAQR